MNSNDVSLELLPDWVYEQFDEIVEINHSDPESLIKFCNVITCIGDIHMDIQDIVTDSDSVHLIYGMIDGVKYSSEVKLSKQTILEYIKVLKLKGYDEI